MEPSGSSKGSKGGMKVGGIFPTTSPSMGVSANEGYLILGSVRQGSYYSRYYVRVPYFRKLQYKGAFILPTFIPHHPTF